MQKIYVIEDQTVLRDLVCRLIDGISMVELVGNSGDGLAGSEACSKLRPDMVIVDIMLPSLNGMEVIRRLRKENPKVKILVFSAYSSRNRVQEALKAGANGIVHKNASIDELEKAIEKVCSGESFMSGEILDIMRDIMLKPEISDDPSNLTNREREILQLIAEGKTTKEVAAVLGISAKTADTHRTNIMTKLDLHDVAGLVRYAIQHEIIVLQ